jgi:hypothetical protein
MIAAGPQWDKNLRVRVCVVFLSLVAIGFSLVPELGRAADGSVCPPSAQYELTCLPPNQLKHAESLFSRRSINLSKAVVQITGLKLSRVILAKRVVPKREHSFALLELDYGTFPPGSAGYPDPSPPTPEWLVVIESVKPYDSISGVVVSRGYSQTVVQGTVTSTVEGNWELWENLKLSGFGIHIISNIGEVAVRQTGRSIRNADHGRK